MNHLFKEQSVKNLVKYNQRLLIITGLLAVSVLLLSLQALSSQEKWVLIPSTNTDKRLTVSSKAFSETYLKEWGIYIMEMLMTTSYDTVDRQVEDLKVVSSSSKDLDGFFKKHLQFVKGSNIQSVFFPKQVVFKEGDVLVSGTFRYWLGSSEKVITDHKTYRLSYKRGPHDVLLLKSVKEEIT